MKRGKCGNIRERKWEVKRLAGGERKFNEVGVLGGTEGWF